MTQQQHRVALMHDGRVLVDETGALPSFASEHRLGGWRRARDLVGADLALAPGVRLADGSILHIVGRRSDPGSGRFVDPSELRAPGLAAAIVESLSTTTRRPGWFAPGWFDLVEAWIDSVLGGSGRRRTHPIVAVKLWSISAVARVPTDAGDLWFKAPCDYFKAESRVHATMSGLFPDLVPGLVATKDDTGWLLMEPMSGCEDETRAPAAGLEVATRWAATQIRAVDHVDELRAGGCRRRGVEETVAAFRRVLGASDELTLLTSDELDTIRDCADDIESLVREFWSAGIPDTIAHGDLHLGNVAWDGTDLRIFDWTDGCLSHPFLDAAHLAHFTRASPGDVGLEARYADQWRAAFPDADIDRIAELAGLVDLVFQTVTFDDLVAATEPISRWELGGVVADLLRTLPGEVAALHA